MRQQKINWGVILMGGLVGLDVQMAARHPHELLLWCFLGGLIVVMTAAFARAEQKD